MRKRAKTETPKKKLTIRRETLERLLSNDELKAVGGGGCHGSECCEPTTICPS